MAELLNFLDTDDGLPALSSLTRVLLGSCLQFGICPVQQQHAHFNTSSFSPLLQAGILGVKVYGTLLEKPQHAQAQPDAVCSTPVEAQPATSPPSAQSRSGDGNGSSAGQPGAARDADASIDAKTAARLRELESQKARAVDQEDYDEAKRLKQLIDHLKAVSLQLLDLEARSTHSVQPCLSLRL